MSVPVPTPEILLDRYFLELRLVNWSKETIDRRSFSIGTFITWCRERGIDCVTEITPEVIESYRRKLYHHRTKKKGKPIKFCTQASYLSAIRHWLAWCDDEGWINPIQLKTCNFRRKNGACRRHISRWTKSKP